MVYLSADSHRSGYYHTRYSTQEVNYNILKAIESQRKQLEKPKEANYF